LPETVDPFDLRKPFVDPFGRQIQSGYADGQSGQFKYQKFNALDTVKEYIRHTYREGWKLPDMPV